MLGLELGKLNRWVGDRWPLFIAHVRGQCLTWNAASDARQTLVIDVTTCLCPVGNVRRLFIKVCSTHLSDCSWTSFSYSLFIVLPLFLMDSFLMILYLHTLVWMYMCLCELLYIFMFFYMPCVNVFLSVDTTIIALAFIEIGILWNIIDKMGKNYLMIMCDYKRLIKPGVEPRGSGRTLIFSDATIDIFKAAWCGVFCNNYAKANVLIQQCF